MRGFATTMVFTMVLGAGMASHVSAGLIPCDTPGLEGRWGLDDGFGTMAGDCSGHDRHGMINGAPYVPGLEGYALRFDGVDDYVDFGDMRPVVNSMTIEAWVVPESVVTGSAMIIGKSFYRAEEGSADSSYRLLLYDNQPCFGFANGANIVFCGSDPLPLNQWSYVAGTYDAATGVAKLYVNCTLVKQVSGIGTGNIQYDTHRALMGAHTGHADAGYYSRFHGYIDELAIYNYALSAADLRRHYLSGPSCECPVTP